MKRKLVTFKTKNGPVRFHVKAPFKITRVPLGTQIRDSKGKFLSFERHKIKRHGARIPKR